VAKPQDLAGKEGTAVPLLLGTQALPTAETSLTRAAASSTPLDPRKAVTVVSATAEMLSVVTAAKLEASSVSLFPSPASRLDRSRQQREATAVTLKPVALEVQMVALFTSRPVLGDIFTMDMGLVSYCFNYHFEDNADIFAAQGGDGGESWTGYAIGGNGGKGSLFDGQGGNGGSASTGNSGSANGGNVVNKGGSIINAPFSSQGGKGGYSSSGNAVGGKGGNA
jgi:hypothetical protein